MCTMGWGEGCARIKGAKCATGMGHHVPRSAACKICLLQSEVLNTSKIACVGLMSKKKMRTQDPIGGNYRYILMYSLLEVTTEHCI